MPDTADEVRTEILIAAPVERVWALLTTPEHVRAWYAFDGARIDLRPGGAIEHHWHEHGTFRGRIERVEPPAVLSYRYSVVPDVEPGPGRQTLVTFRLDGDTDARSTRVQVTESGIAALQLTAVERAGYLAATTAGWRGGLDGLAGLALSTTA